MTIDQENKATLYNDLASLSVSLSGGAITDFRLKGDDVNVLSFRFTEGQMPENNKKGAPFQGHFLCLGRWGPPSDGERKAGMPDHGQAANIMWNVNTPCNDQCLTMYVKSPLEGLGVERTIRLDTDKAVFGVTEIVTNDLPRGRLYNMVQHPTLAEPFLNDTTIVNCNGSIGFDQFRYESTIKDPFSWPNGRDTENNVLDLRTPDKPYSSVFSFVIDKTEEYGWVTAFNPQHQLIFGYVWPRKDYPWIHLWQHWEEKRIKYRGIEFGTAGIHKSFKDILESDISLFGEKTALYIDSGESVGRRYISFLCKSKDGAEKITVEDGGAQILIHTSSDVTSINTKFNNFL